MCGICGILGPADPEIIKKMNQEIHHRGPDEEGYYFNDGVAFGSKRLSIIDLTGGKQPIFNEDKSIVVVFNGEIYNFQSLREELINKGHKFYTNTDTEVIVHAYEEYSTECLQKFNGDFAFALYDRNLNQTFIARDRLGIRPLYYTNIDGKFIFASELKAILASNLANRELDFNSIDQYLTLRYCYGENTFFKNIKKLPAAHFMIIKDGETSINKYWQVDYSSIKLKNTNEYIDKFRELFENSVKLRMISDVPFGAYLSSGIDSSYIVANMAKYSNLPIETYSLGFKSSIDETSDAKNLANMLGCNHHEIFIDKQSYDLLPEIVRYFDEPVGDAIIIPTYLLNKAASQNLKVVLTGEGADEIFGSYVHQLTMHYGNIYKNLIPGFIRNSIINKTIEIAPLGLLDKLFPYPSDLGKKGKEKLLNYLKNLDNDADAYFSIASLFSDADKLKFYGSTFFENIDTKNTKTSFENSLKKNENLPMLNRLIELDKTFWLADYTLLKQDRLSMANSLEARIPFLDHNIVEFISQIPVNLKLRGLTTKYLLRKSAENILPKEITARPKKAFYFPYQDIFDKNFDEYLNELFNQDSRLVTMGIINHKEIKNLCEKKQYNELLPSKQLMNLIILEHWLRIYA